MVETCLWWKILHFCRVNITKICFTNISLCFKNCLWWKLSIVETCLWWKSVRGGNLSMVETCLWCKPVYGGKFDIFCHRQRDTVYVFKNISILENLSKVETCLRWKPVHGGNLSMVETCLWWKPAYGGKYDIHCRVNIMIYVLRKSINHRKLVYGGNCLLWKPVYCRNLSMLETCPRWKPVHSG